MKLYYNSQGINLYRNDFFWNDFVSKWPVTEQQVAAACKRETSDWQLTSCVLEKLFVSTTSCIIINNNLLFCATCRNNKILSQNAGKIFKEFLQYRQSDCGHKLATKCVVNFNLQAQVVQKVDSITHGINLY